MDKKKRKRKLWIRLVALFLVLTMVVGYWASAVTDIRIADDASNAAMSYLATQTDYVNQDKPARIMSLVRSMKKSESLEDYYLQASMRIGSAKYEEALPYIEQCLTLCSPSENRDVYLDVLTKKGCLLALLQRNDEAVETLNKALETNKNLQDVYLVLAQIYLEENDTQKLEETLKTYLDLYPDDTDVRTTYFQTLAAAGKAEEAREQGEMIISSTGVSETNLDDAYHVMAILDFEEENFESALGYLEKIKNNEGTYKDIYYDMGICHMSLSEMDKATECFTRSIEVGYNKQTCLYSRGVCEFSKEEADYQSALEDLVAAYEYEGEDRDEETASMAEEFLLAVTAAE